MFKALIMEVYEALLKPHTLTPAQIAKANEALRKLRREGGYSEKPDVKTKRKVLFKL